MSPRTIVLSALLAGLAVPSVVRGAPAAVTASGQVRFRWEARSPLDYRLPGTFGRDTSHRLGDRGDVALLRSRLALSAVLARGVRGVVEVQDARILGQEASTVANSALVDLHQGYIEADSVGTPDLTLRVGRFEMNYGDQRVVGAADWGNVGRSFDGIRLRHVRGGLTTDAVLTWIAEGRRAGDDRLFGGVHAGWRREGCELDAYGWARDYGGLAAIAESGARGALRDRTFGTRMRWSRGPVELRGEGMHQTGTRAGQLVRAHAADLRASVELERTRRLRLALEYTRASGDGAGDGRWERYDPLFGTAHLLLGYADVMALSNTEDLQATLTAQWTPALSVQVDGHLLRLESARDAWIDDTGNTLRRSASGAAGRDIGRELDLTVRWQARPGLMVTGGASAFLAGEFVKNTGGGGDSGWGFVQVSLGF